MTQISPIDASLIIALVPLVSNIVDCIWLKNKLQMINVVATLLSISGVILLVTDFPNGKAHYGAIAPPLGVG